MRNIKLGFIFLIILIFYPNFLNAQNRNKKELCAEYEKYIIASIKYDWMIDSCTNLGHRERISDFIVRLDFLKGKDSQFVYSLLGRPNDFSIFDFGKRYYTYYINVSYEKGKPCDDKYLSFFYKALQIEIKNNKVVDVGRLIH